MTVQRMSVQQLARIVLHGEELFILDVRNEGDFLDWKIEGQGVEIINIPYYELLDGVDTALEQIPADRKVVVVCAKEGSSRFVAEQLVQSGRSDIYYLQGGMQLWSEHLEPVKAGDLSGGGELYQFVRIGKGCLSYIVISDGEAAIIDSGRMTGYYERFMQEKGVTLKHTLDTHLHADHISGGRALAYRNGAVYHLPPEDAAEVMFAYEKLEEGKDIMVGRERIVVQPLYSPGHTVGSTSLIIDGSYLLTGDILFIESIGRPDLAGLAEEWADDLRETLYKRYKELADELIVLPAHFAKISELGEQGLVSAPLGKLYERNPGLNMMDEQEFLRTVTENLPPQPNGYQQIRHTNMGKLQPSDDEQRELEIGPNRCAVHH